MVPDFCVQEVICQVQGDTIAAIATPLGTGGIGIVRISGVEAISVAAAVFRPARGGAVENTAGYRVRYGHVIDHNGAVIDEALLLLMRQPRSYTGEDSAEISCHGGLVAVRRVLETVLAAGARLAKPGEFTQRAFLNGRIDLAQAEAVVDLVRAGTERSAQVAMQQLHGELSRHIAQLREALIGLVARFEAMLDFPEEEETAGNMRALGDSLSTLRCQVEALLESARTGRILREGLKVVIAGKPNVGKSSLMNALLRQNRAIVTDIPGTTRDLLEESINVSGIPMVLLDTAGINETDDPVERIGVQRSRESLLAAELVLFVVDDALGLDQRDTEVAEAIGARPTLVVINKLDLGRRLVDDTVKDLVAKPIGIVRVAAKNGQGLDRLRNMIAGFVEQGLQISQRFEATDERPIVSNVRHVDALRGTSDFLQAALAGIQNGMPVDLILIDLYHALDRLGEISGETVREDIIDRIFADFCLGK
jgi:tRNA modification GTPase